VDATEASAMDIGDVDPEALEELATSARGWHRIQLAVLGFIGFCGILWDGGDPSAPSWLRWLPAVLVTLALLIAVLAIYVVGRVAYPFRGPIRTAPEQVPQAVEVRARRLRTGIALTYVAMTVLVVATLSGWSPDTAEVDDVAVVADVTGQAWCGELDDRGGDQLRVDTAEGPVTLAVDRVAVIHPVTGC
jgi:hypothetical protein